MPVVAEERGSSERPTVVVPKKETKREKSVRKKGSQLCGREKE